MNFFNAAAYIRLSREDGDKIESNSVGNQREFITRSVTQNLSDVNIIDYYIDDGFTGTNFNRPGFQRMLHDIDVGIINCVIVKDLSRIGRNYIDTGTYLERYFPSHGVRFIALNDGIDNYEQSYDISMPIKNIVNAQYSRDISKKVITSIRTKQEKGDFIGAFAPYGYMKDPKNKNHLIKDEYAATVVERIFKMYASGMGQITIARTLTEEGVPCPSIYKKTQGMKYQNGMRMELTKYWTYSTIHNILKNQVYAGNMVQHKADMSRFRTKQSAILPESEWIVIKDTHVPIISQELFDTVQMMRKRNYRSVKQFEKPHALATHLQCADCHRGMCRVKDTHGRYILRCTTYHRWGRNLCTPHKIYQDVLEKIVVNEINSFIAKINDLDQKIKKPQYANISNRENINNQLNEIAIRIEKNLARRKSLYEDYKDGMISRDEYFSFKQQYEDDVNSLEAQANVLKEKKAQTPQSIADEPWFTRFMKYKKIDQLTPEIVNIFIDMVYVSEDNNITIQFNFKDELFELENMIN